ncbi:hypothetical protein KQR54_18705 [Mycobacterium gordonae]|nr:hypothetical protein [Mycobacterium gordonae]
MAVGDRVPTELSAPSALSATATAKFTNTSASYRTQILEIWLCNTGATARTVSLYKNGTATSNMISNSIALDPGASVVISTHLVLTGTQVLAAKQDTGTDVNIAAYGIVEQIA